jgi:hypothetical protein
MVFVSYSHKDKEWLDRFCTVFSPLKRYAAIDLWSDERIKPGEHWQDEIRDAMANAVVAVPLVSVNFLNSDFIAYDELPYILNAASKQRIKILWIRLTPCLYQLTQLGKIEAAAGFPNPLNQLREYDWMEAFCTVCGEIDKIIRKIETPVINSQLHGRVLQPIEEELQVLAKPAWRDTEILVYSADGWYAQTRIPKGSTKAKCWIGDREHTKSGTSFEIVALTLDHGHLTKGTTYPSLPSYRTKSDQVTVKRA